MKNLTLKEISVLKEAITTHSTHTYPRDQEILG